MQHNKNTALMAMRFSIAQVLAMLENDDINGNEDVPMMPGSDDEFGSEGGSSPTDSPYEFIMS